MAFEENGKRKEKWRRYDFSHAHILELRKTVTPTLLNVLMQPRPFLAIVTYETELNASNKNTVYISFYYKIKL